MTENQDPAEMLAAMLATMMNNQADPSAAPFKAAQSLGSNIIDPIELDLTRKEQQAISVHPLFDKLCLKDDLQTPLGGVPSGSTILLDGFPGCGKTRTGMEMLLRAANQGIESAYVVSEEGYSDPDSGRDDLHSRLMKLSDKLGFEFEKLAAHITVVQCQYHRGQTWNDFVDTYRKLQEVKSIKFAIIDSLTGLDPLNNKMVSNLNALKTYNHSVGITCIVISQIKESGVAAGGNAVMHTADVVFHVDHLSLGSKEMASDWGGKYREKVKIISVVKSNTTPVYPLPVKLGWHPVTATLCEAEDNPNKLGE